MCHYKFNNILENYITIACVIIVISHEPNLIFIHKIGVPFFKRIRKKKKIIFNFKCKKVKFQGFLLIFRVFFRSQLKGPLISFPIFHSNPVIHEIYGGNYFLKALLVMFM